MAAAVRMSAVKPSEGTFNASRVPRSLQQKQIIVTGGTSGIGLEATKVGVDAISYMYVIPGCLAVHF